MRRKIKKEITFICTTGVEKLCCNSIAEEAIKRGFKVKFTENIFEKCEIGVYLSHLNYPQNSKFSVIMLHDLGQQHGEWPIMWKNEYWNIYDVGFLPSLEWVKMWESASCYRFACPKKGCYFAGWPKADATVAEKFNDEANEVIKKYNIDTSKKTILYAPSWEWDGRQLEMIESVKNMDVNLIIKQFPVTPDRFPWHYKIVMDAMEKSKGKKNTILLDPKINIFTAISICDVLVSEESSTLFEAMLMGKPVIAVKDWLVPDNYPEPPRLPNFSYDFAVRIEKKDLEKTLNEVLNDSKYENIIRDYKENNFPKVGVAAPMILDVIEAELFGKENKHQKIKESEKVRIPKEYKKSVNKRKWALRKYKIRKQIFDKNKFLTALFNVYHSIKHR